MAPQVSPIPNIRQRSEFDERVDYLSVILWSSGLVPSQRNMERIKLCLPLFRRTKYLHGQTVISRNSVSEYAFLVVSGNCSSAGMPLGPGSWLGLDCAIHGTPEPCGIRVSSPVAILLRIESANLLNKLPKELSTNLRSRVRAVCRVQECVNTKAVFVHTQMLTARRDPSCMATARLVSLGLLSVATNPDTIREQITTSRQKLHELVDSSA